MSKPLIRIHNLETDEIIDREMTDEEFALYEIEKEAHEIAKNQEAQKTAERLELLNRLGITEDEAKLILG